MEYMSVYELPEERIGYLILAFAGWPDAGEGATNAVRYLVKKLPVRKCAELDPEEFYDFILTRPRTVPNPDHTRTIYWPSNEMYCCILPATSQGLLLFFGVEPNLKWKTYARTILDVAQHCGVHTVVNLGSLLDAVPHTREAKVSGGSNRGQFNRSLERLGVQGTDYTGPTGIASAVMEQSTKAGMLFLSLWGHAPHYLQATPNYMVSYSLLIHLKRVLGLDLDLAELEAQARTFVSEIDKVTSRDPQIQAYVQRLEQQYDETLHTQEPLPPPQEVIKELEEFLRESRGGGQEGPGQA